MVGPGDCSSALEQWFSTILVQQPFITIPPAVVTSKQKIVSLLLCNCNFATVMNPNVDICYVAPVKGLFHPQRGCPDTQVESCQSRPRSGKISKAEVECHSDRSPPSADICSHSS